MFQHTEAPPISLGWDDKLAALVERVAPTTCNDLSNIASNDEVDDSSKLNEHNTYRISRRQKKLPVNRTDDFLWQL